MLEIIILIFLTRKIGDKATLKGQPAGKWKLFTVLGWIGAEIVGVVLGMLISGNLVLAALMGLVCAVGGYLLVSASLNKYPDNPSQFQDWMDNIGNTPNE